MQFIKNNDQISFTEFSTRFPVEAKFLSKKYHSDVLDDSIKFIVSEERLSLAFKKFSPIKIDINSILHNHKTYFFKNSFYKDPLARAIGLKKGKDKPVILDATAGMLGDSLLIFAYGVKKLICCERNPLVASLIHNALSISKLPIFFHYGPVDTYKAEESIDVIFYDPMYKESNSKTAPKKEMAIFRELVGADEDVETIALYLKNMATERLVIKRPNRASPLLQNPSHTIKGKSTSYDVYLQDLL